MTTGGRTEIRKPTVVRPISWLAAIPQLLALGFAVGIGYLIWPSHRGVMAGAAVYLVYSIASRAVMLASHQRGMRLIRAGRYDEAIAAFEASYAFLSCHPWIDRFRSVTMMSAAAVSYREMALVNVAFAHVQAGRRAEAKAAYERTLRQYPDCKMAQATLQQIDDYERSSHAP